MEDLYNRIVEVCKQHGTTFNQVRIKAGLSAGTMSDLKSGKTKDISRKTAQKLADVLGITVDELYGDAPTEVEQIQDELFVKRKILFDLSAKASKEDLEKFIKMMNAIIDED